MNSTTYHAHWRKTLRWMSVFSLLFMLAAATVLALKGVPQAPRWLALLPLLLGASAVIFVIRDFTIESNILRIQRLFWTTRLPLSGLLSVAVTRNAMRGSRRLCGSAGMFSITGWYRSPALGTYRAYVTDLQDTVVLRFPGRTIVVSQQNLDRFAAEISQFAFRSS